MKSVILAGGFGTRIRPLTLSVPKSLFEFCNRPCVEYQIEASKRAGINHVILTVFESFKHYDLVKRLSEKYDVKIDVSIEPTPLGTAGSLRFARDLILKDGDDCEDFFVFNTDIICEYPLEDMIESHRKNNSKLTRVENTREYGTIIHDDNNKIEAFLEKIEDARSNEINAGTPALTAGVYLLNRDVLDHIPLRNYSIEKEFFPEYLKFGTSYAHRLGGYWYAPTTRRSDIGTPCRYLNAQNMHLNHLAGLEGADAALPGADPCERLVEGYGILLTTVGTARSDASTPPPSAKRLGTHDTFKFRGPVLVVEDYCYIEGSIVGWESRVKKWARIEGLSVLGKDVTVEESLFLRGTIVLPHKTIKASNYEDGKILI